MTKPVTVTVNGRPVHISQVRLSDFLASLNIHHNSVAVAINNNVIPSADYPLTRIRDGDRIEIIHPVSGG